MLYPILTVPQENPDQNMVKVHRVNIMDIVTPTIGEEEKA
jgi:hypothetical protein